MKIPCDKNGPAGDIGGEGNKGFNSMTDITIENSMVDIIKENTAGPKRVSGDAGSVEQHSLTDQIAADKHIQSHSPDNGWAPEVSICVLNPAVFNSLVSGPRSYIKGSPPVITAISDL